MGCFVTHSEVNENCPLCPLALPLAFPLAKRKKRTRDSLLILKNLEAVPGFGSFPIGLLSIELCFQVTFWGNCASPSFHMLSRCCHRKGKDASKSAEAVLSASTYLIESAFFAPTVLASTAVMPIRVWIDLSYDGI